MVIVNTLVRDGGVSRRVGTRSHVRRGRRHHGGGGGRMGRRAGNHSKIGMSEHTVCTYSFGGMHFTSYCVPEMKSTYLVLYLERERSCATAQLPSRTHNLVSKST